MNSGLSLIVPMQVEALCISHADANGHPFALRPMADFSTLPYVSNGVQHNRKPYINADVVSLGGPFEGQIVLPAGVHLHWALPAGLMRGQQQPDGSLLYPNVPNRWMVTRIYQQAKNTNNAYISNPAPRSWIIESDRLNDSSVCIPGMHQPTVPLDPNTNGKNFAYIGQCFDANGWTETSANRFNNLTAVGYGEATFASYYPNCSTVFGFQDTLADIPNFDSETSSLTYQITGWYSDPSKDPIADGINPADNNFGWTFTDPGQTVNNTVCTGFIDNVGWGEQSYISSSDNALTVAIGGSSQEAVSALLAQSAGSDPDTAETILNAMQFGLLSDNGAINGSIENFEEIVHQAGFSSIDGGTTWQVRKKARAGTDENYDGEVTLPEPIAQDLNTLNLQQTQIDEMKETLASKRWQLFSDWYKYLLVEYDTRYTPEEIRSRAQDIRDALLRQANEITSLQERVSADGALQESINTLAAFITSLLDDQFELTSDVAAPRYWQAGNPYIVMQGDDIVPANRTGNGTLACRTVNQLTQIVIVPTFIGDEGMNLSSANCTFSSVPTNLTGSPGYLLNQLFTEALFLSPSLQHYIINNIIIANGGSGSYWGNAASMTSTLTTALQKFLNGEPTNGVEYVNTIQDYRPVNSTAPEKLMATNWTETPWLPVMVQYDVAFNPVAFLQGGDSYPENFLLSNFNWDHDSIELEYQKTEPPVQQTYRGTMLLSSDSQIDLAESIRQYILQTESTDIDLQSILESLQNHPVLAQEFDGVNQSMIMRRQNLQMKVADPLANTFDQSFVATIAAAVGNESVFSPEPNFSFNPIRTGTFFIESLRLVDVFGRFKDNDSIGTVHVAKGLKLPAGISTTDAGLSFLPPRITQPSRLLFRWLSANNDTIESNSHPASSPIIGWVLPDYPDNSLYLYNAEGIPLGEMAVSADGQNRVLWFAAPGGAFPLDTDLQTVMENELPWLRNFAVGIYNNGNAQLLSSLLASLTVTASQTMPAGSSNNTAGILAGQPLAITRASLTLDLMGDPAANESWESFANTLVPNGDPDYSGFDAVKFPVKLGAPGNFNDGLFAYWIQEDTAINFNTFYAPGSLPQGNDLTGIPLSLTTGHTRGSTKTVLMLVDPKGEVHATTGILPVKSIAVPSDQYDAALSSLSVTFLTAPVLSGSNTNELDIPLPKINAGKWSWVSIANNQWQSQDFSDTVQNSNQGALDYTPQQLLEGWLRLRDFEN